MSPSRAPEDRSRSGSLRLKVAISVSLLLVAVAGIVAVALIRQERYFLTREGEKRVKALAESLAANARDPLLVGEELRLGPIVRAVMQDEDALYAWVADHRDVVVFHTDTGLIGSPVTAAAPRGEQRILAAAAPITVEQTRVGTAGVALDARFIGHALRTTARGLLLPLAAGTLAGVLGTFLLTGLHVRRIESLDRAVAAVGEGDRTARAEVAGNDEVARLAARFNRMVEQLAAARDDLESGFTETVSSLAAAIEAKDAYTRGHCERVARLSCAMAERLGTDRRELKNLELAAILHDVGKIGVPATILAKKGRLTAEEFDSMREHPAIGARILAPLSFLGEVIAYVRHHHEDYDGGGYPEGLAGEAIPRAARIIHLVDAYDAMTSSRPYRQALPHAEAMRRIHAEAGRQFDPELVELFAELERQGVIAQIRAAVATEGYA